MQVNRKCTSLVEPAYKMPEADSASLGLCLVCLIHGSVFVNGLRKLRRCTRYFHGFERAGRAADTEPKLATLPCRLKCMCVYGQRSLITTMRGAGDACAGGQSHENPHAEPEAHPTHMHVLQAGYTTFLT